MFLVIVVVPGTGSAFSALDDNDDTTVAAHTKWLGNSIIISIAAYECRMS